MDREHNMISLNVGKFNDNDIDKENGIRDESTVLILGAGRVCRPAAEFLTELGRGSSQNWSNSYITEHMKENTSVHVIVASLFLKEAEEVSLIIFTSKFSLMLIIRDHRF